MKSCTKCQVQKRAKDFHKNSKASDGRDARCKLCRNAARRSDWKSTLPAKRRQITDRTFSSRLRYRRSPKGRRKAAEWRKKNRVYETGQRFDVFRRDSFTCRYCGRKPPEVVIEVDHVHPQSRGGSSRMDNLVTACRDCNVGKSNKLIEMPL